jgi:hypothetical protein
MGHVPTVGRLELLLVGQVPPVLQNEYMGQAPTVGDLTCYLKVPTYSWGLDLLSEGASSWGLDLLPKDASSWGLVQLPEDASSWGLGPVT